MHSWAAVGAAGDLVDLGNLRPLQLGVLPPQPAQFLQLGAGRSAATLTPVGFVLADPVAQRFVMHPELAG